MCRTLGVVIEVQFSSKKTNAAPLLCIKLLRVHDVISKQAYDVFLFVYGLKGL